MVELVLVRRSWHNGNVYDCCNIMSTVVLFCNGSCFGGLKSLSAHILGRTGLVVVGSMLR